MQCATSTRRVAGVTLVTCRLSSDVPREVRLRNELDGPVWPPRRRGVPERGWGDEGATLSVDGTVGVGYACPAPAVDPPATVEVLDGGDGDPGAGNRRAESPRTENRRADGGGTPAANEVVRSLGDPTPPRDAVVRDLEAGEDYTSADGEGRASADGEECAVGNGEDGGDHAEETPSTGVVDVARERVPEADRRRTRVDGPCDGGPTGPAAVAEWLAAVERRVERLERLASAETVPEATEALRAAGGLDGAVALAEAVERDREALVALGERADWLAERATADPDLAAMRRLA